ncbi:MAG TPA: aminoglycoside phosphotransferase family protein [Longimicrobiaceae bacterium]|nr:aminoglycoside phosphotransferase family protein [Longimicrobiaceae bacterium]
MPSPLALIHHSGFSNDLAEVRLDHGRSLIVKRGRYSWSPAGFETARFAARLLRERADILTPASLDLPPHLDERPLEAYWRIERPTLAELWPDLGQAERRGAMMSLGRLIRRLHDLGTAGHGELTTALERATSLSQALAEDLGGRLMPAISTGWPEAASVVDLLLEMIPEVVRRTAPDGVVLHGDLHMANVLCERDELTVRCVGLLDLECAHAGPPESDLARLAVIQTDLFQMPVEGAWLDWVREGYTDPLDPLVFRFYAIYHLLVLGHHSASIGHDVHAEHVAAAARAAAAGLTAPGGKSQNASLRPSSQKRAPVMSSIALAPNLGELVDLPLDLGSILVLLELSLFVWLVWYGNRPAVLARFQRREPRHDAETLPHGERRGRTARDGTPPVRPG